MNQFIDKIPNKNEALELFNLKGKDMLNLFSVANSVREKYCGNKMHVCTITNAKSGKCSENCRFCAQSSHYKTDISTYDMKDVNTLKNEYLASLDFGSSHFGIVTSGKEILKNSKEYKTILSFLEKDIKENLKPCVSIGVLSLEIAKELKNNGVTRYHNNIQTAPSKYNEIVATTHSIEDRINSIKIAKSAGLEVCSGGIIGMGETFEARLEMAYTLLDLNVDSVPINILNPIKGTPLENVLPLNYSEILKTIAIFRLILKDKVIKIAAGRETILKDFMGTAFLAGANGLLIGGYLTVKGRSVEEDKKFIAAIEDIWNG